MSVEKSLLANIEWAEERLRNGAEPPFIYYRLMQLREAASELLAHARRLEVGSPESGEHSGSALQQAASIDLPKIVQLRPSDAS